MPKYKNNKKGFTLVELLAVVIILIIIMTIAITTVNKQMEKTRKNAFIADVNIFIKAAQQKYSSDRSNHAAGEDLFHNAIEGKVCYSIDQQLIGKYADKTSESYTGSVEVCYGEECEYAIKVWATDGEHYVDGATYLRDKKDIKKKYTTEYPLTCGVEALGGGGTGGDLLTAEFESRPEEYKMTIVKDGVYSLEAWGGQAGRYMELRGGYGGYAYTEIELHVGDTLYINVGGAGGDYSSVTGYGKGGYNGGADGASNRPGGGGGATTITTKPGFLYDNILPDYVYLVAGGGGSRSGSECCCDAIASGFSGGGACDEANRICQSNHNYGKATFGGAGGGFRAQASNIGCNYPSGGSGYIGNPLTKNGVMYGYNVSTNTSAKTKTISTKNISEKPISGYAKQGEGFARITYIGTFTNQE